MKRMEEMILSEGKVLPGGVLKVGSFLNQQVDTNFMREIGDEIARLYKDDGATKILTIESSGIPIAISAGFAMGLPVVYAKKNKSSNVSGDVYYTPVKSFTHGDTNNVVVAKEYISPEDRVLIVDDFLAHGSALTGLIDIVDQAGAALVGCVAAIEKGFQLGGDKLREQGYRVESLAIVDEMTDDGITFRPQY
ncbi:MAG: xanthine phosphoribosyltransferase [Clostridiales bacterium]|nr:xanthine phosphoribosyltransferase [Clostridiales bacterium]MBR0468848.1 xanthine phosphoribosyltransferase [Mogibacterium sp.]